MSFPAEFRPDYRQRSLFLTLLALAGFLRFFELDRLSLWADELWVVMGSVQGSVDEMLAYIHSRDNHPPGHYLLMRTVQTWFGPGDFAVRAPSALAGTLLVAATYRLGCRYFNARVALFATALVTVSYTAIYYSQEARPNIFMALFCVLALQEFLAVAIRGEHTVRRVATFVLWATLAAYFHYAGLVFIACLGVILLPVLWMVGRRHAFWKSALVLFVPCVLLYLPWLASVLHHLVATPVTAWQRVPDLKTLWTTFRFLFGPDDGRIWFFVIVSMASIALLVRQSREQRVINASLLAMIVLPVMVFFIKSVYSQDAYNHRHFLYAIPLLALLAGNVLDILVGKSGLRLQSALTSVILLVIVGWQLVANERRALYTANHFKQEFREVAQVVAGDKVFLQQDHTLIVANTSFFDHYLKQFIRPARHSGFIYDWAEKANTLHAVLQQQQANNFYYLEAPIIPGRNQMVTVEDLRLLQQYQLVCRTRFARAQAFRFAVVDHPPVNDIAVAPDCRNPLP